jgi:hypothetical protein
MKKSKELIYSDTKSAIPINYYCCEATTTSSDQLEILKIWADGMGGLCEDALKGVHKRPHSDSTLWITIFRIPDVFKFVVVAFTSISKYYKFDIIV